MLTISACLDTKKLTSIGDAFEFWTSCKYKSTLHRVISPANTEGKGHDRYSMAFFNQPLADAVLEPVIAATEVSESKQRCLC